MHSGRESQRVLANVAKALGTKIGGLRRAPRTRSEVLDAVYTFPCGVVGMHHCETWDELDREWRDAQHELGSLMRRHSAGRGWGNDAYLLFVLGPAAVSAASDPARENLLREIRASASECLKEVLPFGEDWKHLLEDLTFVPLKRPTTVLDRTTTAVKYLLEQIGIPPELAANLTQVRPGARLVAQAFEKGEYRDAPKILTPPIGIALRRVVAEQKGPRYLEVDPAQGVHLQRLSLANFRSFCSKERSSPNEIDLSSDLVLIYGENGTGKTCLAQAIEWAVGGSVQWLLNAVDREHVGLGPRMPFRSIWSEREPAKVCLELSEGSKLRCVEASDGSRTLSGSFQDEETLWDQMLGVSRRQYQRIDEVRDQVIASFFLPQARMSELLSTCEPEERLRQFATLLGDSGLARAQAKLEDIGREVGSRLRALRQELVSLKEREETARNERNSISAELDGLGESTECALTPEQYLERAREYDARLGVTVLHPLAQADSEEAMDARIQKITEYLEQRRTALVSAVNQSRRRSQLSSELASARTKLAQLKHALEEGRRGREETAGRVSTLEEHLVCIEGEVRDTNVRYQQCGERRQAIERWLKTKPEADDLKGALSGVEQRIPSLGPQADAMGKEIGAKSAGLESGRGLLEEAQRRREAARQYMERVVELVQLLRQHGKVDERLEVLRAEREKTAASLTTVRQDLATARQQREGLMTRMSSLGTGLDRIRSRREGRDHLLQEIREYIDSDECPLCSHRHASRGVLEGAIRTRIGAPSAEEQSLLQQLRQEKATLDQHERDIAELEGQFATLQQTEQNSAEELARITEVRNAIHTIVSSLHLPIDVTLEEASAEIGCSQKSAEDAEKDALRCESDVGVREKALQEVIHRRQTLWDELSHLSAEKHRLEQQMNEMTGRIQLVLGSLPDDNKQLSQEAERLRNEEASLAARVTEGQVDANRIRSDLDASRQVLNARGARFQAAQQQADECNQVITRLESDLGVLGAEEGESDFEAAQQELVETEGLVRDGRSVLRVLAAVAAGRRLTDADAQLSSSIREKQAVEESIGRLVPWQQVCENAVTVLQKEEALVVEDGLEPIRSLMQRIHARLSRHPIFREVSWRIEENKLHFWARPRAGVGIADEDRLVQCYMNEAQQNIVALSVFLASALCRGGRLRTVVLDDPVQAMDEVNIYGLLDLLRQVSRHTQVIMTTGRNDLFHLARAKFACMNDGTERRFRAYRLKWGGPEVGTLVEDVT